MKRPFQILLQIPIRCFTISVVALAYATVPSDLLHAQQQESQIIVSGDEFDFGYIPFGKTVKHTLYIINDADTTLRITKVSPGCGCTTIPLKERVAQPGDTLEVDLLLDTGKISRGEFQKSPRINTDSRMRPQIVCKLKGINYDTEGQAILDISPIAIEIPKLRDSDSTKVILKNLTQLTLIPHLIEAPPPHLIAVNVPSRAIIPGRELEVDVTIIDLSGERADVIYDSFTLALNDPARTRITIPIKIMK